MPVTAIIEFDDADDHADALEVPNVENHHSASVTVVAVDKVNLTIDNRVQVKQQDGSVDYLGSVGTDTPDAKIVSCF